MSVVQSETLYSLYWNLCINPSSVSVDWSATSGAQPWSIIDICQFPHSTLSIFYHLYSSQYLSNSFSALSPSHRSPSMVTLSLSFVFFLFGNLLIPDYSKVYPQASSTPCKSFSFLHHFLIFPWTPGLQNLVFLLLLLRLSSFSSCSSPPEALH